MFHDAGSGLWRSRLVRVAELRILVDLLPGGDGSSMVARPWFRLDVG
jgi:hypothetical protein